MTVALGDIIRTSARFKNAISGDVVNVFHWLVSSGTNDSDDNVMTAIETKLSAIYATIASDMPDNQDPYDVRHDVVTWLNGKETVIRTLGTRTWTLSTPPSASTDALPQQNALVVNFRTIYPKTFGRKYLGCLIEGSQSAGVMNSTSLARFASLVTAVLGAITTGGSLELIPGVITYKEAGGDHFAPFVAGVVNAIICIQRRRRANRGS